MGRRFGLFFLDRLSRRAQQAWAIAYTLAAVFYVPVMTWHVVEEPTLRNVVVLLFPGLLITLSAVETWRALPPRNGQAGTDA